MKSKNYSKKISKIFKKKGFIFLEPDILLDSNYIIQRSGENFKKLMLTFDDDSGKNMCLRPDLTVASCVKYLEENTKGTSKIYYSGQAYRRSNNSKDSIVNNQLGLEIIGSKKESSDDKEILDTILNSVIDGIAENKASEWRTFGRFSPKKIKEKMGRNPRTNEKIYVPEKISVKFKMAKELKNKINQNESYTN